MKKDILVNNHGYQTPGSSGTVERGKKKSQRESNQTLSEVK